MGRKKIEIQPITDERNRSITFVKRKAGLFKKAHELAILCQVDLAVIIVNNNNNSVYEFSSGNVNHVLQKYADAPSVHRDSSFSGDYDDNGKFHKRNMSHEDTDSDQESSFHDIKRHRTLSPNMVGAASASKQLYSPNFSSNGAVVSKFGYPNSQQQGIHVIPNSQNYINSSNAAAADSVFAAAAAVSSSMDSSNNNNNNSTNGMMMNSRFNQYQKLPMVSSKLGQFEESSNSNTAPSSLGIYQNDSGNSNNNNNNNDNNNHLNVATSTPNMNPNGGTATAGTLLSASSSASSSFIFPPPVVPASLNNNNNGNPITKINTNIPLLNSPYNNSTATFSSIATASPSYTNRSTPSSARPVLKVQIPADKDAKKPDMAASNTTSILNNNGTGTKLPTLEENSNSEKIPISATLPSALFLPLGGSGVKDSNKQPPTAGLMSSTIRPLLFGGNSNGNNNNNNGSNNNLNGGEQTPVSGFPLMSARFGDGSRYMNEFFPSPSNYYGEWNVPNGNSGVNSAVGGGSSAIGASTANPISGNTGLPGGSDTPVKLTPGVMLSTPSSTNAENYNNNKDSVSSSSSTTSGNNASGVKKEDGPSTTSSATVFSGPASSGTSTTIKGAVNSTGAGPSLNTLHNNSSSSSDLSKHSLNNPNGSVKDELPSPIGFPSGLPFGKLKRSDSNKND